MYALGRLVNHDPRSRNFAFTATRAIPSKTIRHPHYGPVLDQGNVGACTGFAMAQWLNCKPGHKPYTKTVPPFQALRFYSRATQIDPWSGWYNLDTGHEDTGSSGLAVCKAAQEAGFITGYRWIFEGTDQLKAALQVSPVMAGTVWLEGMFASRNGYLNVTGAEVGGHEYLIVGWNQPSRYFTILNSWGNGWERAGYARIREQDMAWLLAQQGDLIVPTKETQ